MEVVAESKYVRQSPRKLRLVADQVRGLGINEAAVVLENLKKRGARPILLTLKQAISNAVNNFQLKKEDLKLKKLEINEGPAYKRMDKAHRAFRWGTIKKRTSHIRIILEAEKEEEKKSKVQKKKKSSKSK